MPEHRYRQYCALAPALDYQAEQMLGGGKGEVARARRDHLISSGAPLYPALYRSAIEALAPLAVRLLVTVGDPARELEELGTYRPTFTSRLG